MHWEVVLNGGHDTSMKNPEAYAENSTLFFEMPEIENEPGRAKASIRSIVAPRILADIACIIVGVLKRIAA